MYKLKSWIDPNLLDLQSLSLNPNAIDYLTENPEKIIWYYLSMNNNAINLLEKYPNKVDSYNLCNNVECISDL